MTFSSAKKQKESGMNTQRDGGRYVVIVWDYDAAPDAAEYINPEGRAGSIAPYYASSRRKFPDLSFAINFAKEAVDVHLRTGAAVFETGRQIFACGSVVFPFQEEYW